jgi:TonB family protein
MPKRKNHIVNSKDYQRYLEDQMTPKERHDFEMRLLDDDFADEAFEGLSQMTPEELSKDLNSLKIEIHSKAKKRNVFPFWQIAATLMLLGVFSFLVYYLIESNTTTESVQSKSISAVEEVKDEQATSITDLDSTENEQDRIVAYQQKMEEEPVDKEIPKSNIRESRAVPEKEAELEELEMLEVEDPKEKLEEMVPGLEVAPIELPSLAEVQNELIEMEEAPSKQKSERFRKEAAAPAVAMKKQAAAQENLYVAKEDNVRTITGTVRSVDDGLPIPGVNIVAKGTGYGTNSDIDGNYSITVPADEEITLRYSFIGIKSKEVVVGEQQTIDVNMELDITRALNEIVVTADGTERRRDVTGAVSTVEVDDFDTRAVRYDSPLPVGGNEAFKDYVKENIRYPSLGLADKVKGTVKLIFTVEQNGNISNIEVLKSMGDDFDNEAIRLVSDGPKWEPAKENDVAVAKEVKVKIRFRPPE